VADGDAPAPRRAWLGGIRVRTTAAAVLVVGIALLLASIGIVRFVDRSLTAEVGDQAELRARQIASEVVPDGTVIPVGDREDEFVQVLDGDTVVASSANVKGEALLAVPRPDEQVRLNTVPFVDGPFVVAAVPMEMAARVRTIVVGRSIDDVVQARSTVTHALLLGMPALLAVVGAVTWWIVGRALRPVEGMRDEVERISSRELHRRVPDPPGDDEVSRLAATMNRMLDRLESGQERQRRFVSDASHELRSPVASIRQHAEVAKGHPDGTNVEELAEVVLEEDARLQRLVDDLLLLAKLDEGAQPRTDGEVDLDDVVLSEAARIRTATPLDVDTRGVSAGRVLGDRGQLERLVRNLTENAARHASSRTALGLSAKDGRVLLSVDDDGPGIPAEARDRVFERFVRVDGARGRSTGGTGLGLAIVREIAAAHRGTVSMGESSLGGLRVEVRFPTDG
jgi:signal transduction histidine kinase